MRCPNCGSMAQVRFDSHDTYVWEDTVSVYLTYKCGCGCRFASRLEINRREEKFCGEKKGWQTAKDVI